MRSVRAVTIVQDESADAVFQAALGVAQNNKKMTVIAVHNEGRKLVLRERTAMSSPKLYVVIVEQTDTRSDLMLAVGNDPRTSAALLDGKFNQKALGKYVEAVRSVLDGSTSAPVTPVANHFLQGKSEVPWDNPDDEPDIELGGNLAAVFLNR